MKKFSNLKIKLVKESDTTVNPLLLSTEEPMLSPNNLSDVTKSEPSKFISKLFESREMAHIYHLQIKGNGSYAGHNALNEYYSGILELIDELTEIYQGQYDIIENYDVINTSGTKTLDKIQYFIELAEFIKQTRYKAFLQEDTHLQNIIDEVLGLIYRTLYKLRHLK